MQVFPEIIRIGTRASKLALAQAHFVRSRLLAAHALAEEQVVIVPMTTTGDVRMEPTLADIGGKGLFTKEIEEALLLNKIDMAVHSLKDMPTFLPEGLMLAAIPEREDARDAFVSTKYDSFAALPQGATVGTSSPRRVALLKYRRPDLNLVPLRGNVPTRLDKLRQGSMDAIVLAVAGLNRLGLQEAITHPFEIGDIPPAAGQGAICIECREENAAIRELLQPINHRITQLATEAERAVLARLDGSCRTPIAAHAYIENDYLNLIALVLSLDGAKCYDVHYEGYPEHAIAMGDEAGQVLLEKAGPGFICS